METKTEDDYDMDGMLWTDVKQLQHCHLINYPKNLSKELQMQVELPYPIFDPAKVAKRHTYGKLFQSIPQLDSRLKYCRKMYSKSNQNLFKTNVKKKTYLEVPQYVVDAALGAFDNYEDRTWHYTGGTLDLISCNHSTYIARSNSKYNVQVTGMNSPDMKINLKLGKESSIYGLTSKCYNEDAFIAVRQNRKISLYHLSCNDTLIQAPLVWKLDTVYSVLGIAFSRCRDDEISLIDDVHTLKVKSFLRADDIVSHKIPSKSVSDRLAQIDYIDCNTMCVMNRNSIYLLDLRSLSIQKSSYPTLWLKCDDLCTFTKNKNDLNSICVAATHSVMKLDMRSLKFDNKVSHMLTTPPFLSSMTTDPQGEYVCLFGEHAEDKVLLYNCSNTLNIPQYVPSIKDTLIATSLTNKINHTEYLVERLSLPILGMKLFNDDVSGNPVVFTSNSVGDVFQQKLGQSATASKSNIESKFAGWVSMLPHKPKVLEATSICNLSNVRHVISDRFPEEKKLMKLMKDDNSQKMFEKEHAVLRSKLEGHVGEAMNAIWTDDKILSEDSGISSTVLPKLKVSKWLNASS